MVDARAVQSVAAEGVEVGVVSADTATASRFLKKRMRRSTLRTRRDTNCPVFLWNEKYTRLISSIERATTKNR